MRSRFKRTIAMMLAGLLVLGGLQGKPLQARAEGGTEERTYDFTQLTKAGGWGVTDTVTEEGAVRLEFNGQYQSVFYRVPEELDFGRVTKVTFRLTEGDASELAFKLHTEADYNSSEKGGTPVSYGNPAVIPTDKDIKYLSVMSIAEGKSPAAVLSGIVFTVSGAGSVSGGDEEEPAPKTTDVTYNFVDLTKTNSYNVNLSVGGGGELTMDYTAQYGESFYQIPEGIDFAKVKKMVFQVKSGNAGSLGFKLYGEGTEQLQVVYGNATVIPSASGVRSFGIMSCSADPITAKLSGVTFTVEGEAEIVKAYTFAELSSNKKGNVTAEVNGESGAVLLSFDGQYQEIFYQIPKEINFAGVQKLIFDVTDGSAGNLAYKLYTEDGYTMGSWPTAFQTSFGNPAVTPEAQNARYIGIMSMNAGKTEATLGSVAFHTTGWGYSEEETGGGTDYGDNLIRNPYFAEEDLTVWSIANGNAVLSRGESHTPIFEDVTSYGVISGRTTSQDCFAQDITAAVENKKEYAYEFYAMLSGDYEGAPAEQRQVDFAPYIVAGGITTYLGSYSPEITGTCSQRLEPGVWTKFAGTFKLSSAEAIEKVVIRLLEQGTNYGSGDCVKGEYCVTGVSLKEIVKEKPQIEKDVPDLKDTVTQELCDITGVALMNSELTDEALMELVTKHFNAVTPGNELKPDAMFGYNNSKCPGTEEITLNGETLTVPVIDYSRAETMLNTILAWNAEHPDDFIRVRGHVLLWHSQTPEWFFHENYDKTQPYVTGEVMNRRLEWYIKSVLEHFTGADSKYKDLFYGWDVVNEAVSDNTGTYRSDVEAGSDSLSDDTHGSKSSWWHVYQSNEFIIKAFTYANKYAPAGLELYYNDYNECTASKRDAIVTLLRAVKEAEGEPGTGTRIDGMGLQGHYNITSPTPAQLESAVRAYAAVVGRVQMTEFDLKASSEFDGTDAARASEYTKQAYRYKDIYDTLKKLNAEDGIEVTGITIWGVIDKNSWLQTSSSVGGGADGKNLQCPLLFDDYYKVKPAYWAFVDPSKLEPSTQNITVVQSEDGSFAPGREYSYEQSGTQVSFIPVWEKDGMKVQVNVADSVKEDTDSVTVYVDACNSRKDGADILKVTVARSEAEETEDGYRAVVAVPLNGKAVADKLGFDMQVTNGSDKAVFNDLTLHMDTSSKYYAEAILKPYITIPKGTVTVDGEEDAVWSSAQAVPVTINLNASVEAQARLLWDENNLYVYARVKDPCLNNANAESYQQDSLEVFIDENNAKTDSYEGDDKQYRISYENLHSFNGEKCREENVISAARTTEDGYIIEAAYKWTDISPSADREIGLEIQINDADATGKRIGTLSWYDETGMGWSSPSIFGTAMLVEAAGEEDEPSGAEELGNSVDALEELIRIGGTEEEKADAAGKILDMVARFAADGTAVLTKEDIVKTEKAVSQALGNKAVAIEQSGDSLPMISKVTGALLNIGVREKGKLVAASVAGERMPQLGESYRNAYAFDLKLMKEDQPVAALAVPVTIRMAVPASIDTAQPVKILHFAEGSASPDLLEVTLVNKEMEFTTPGFSTFVIVNVADGQGGNVQGGNDDPNPGNNKGEQNNPSTANNDTSVNNTPAGQGSAAAAEAAAVKRTVRKASGSVKEEYKTGALTEEKADNANTPASADKAKEEEQEPDKSKTAAAGTSGKGAAAGEGAAGVAVSTAVTGKEMPVVPIILLAAVVLILLGGGAVLIARRTAKDNTLE